MKLLRLSFENINALQGEFTIDFTRPEFNSGLFCITGVTGSGKTTILDAICLALFAQTPRLGKITSNNNALMSSGTNSCFAEVEILIDNQRYAMYFGQTKTKTGKLGSIKRQLYRYDANNKRSDISSHRADHTEKAIIKTLKMNFDQFTRSVLLAQGNFTAFLTANDKEKSALLEQITGSQIYTIIGNKAKELFKEKQRQKDYYDAQLNAIHCLSDDKISQLNQQLQSQLEQQAIKNKELNTISDKINALTNYNQYQEKLSNYQEHNTTIQAELKQLEPKIIALSLAKKAQNIQPIYDKLKEHQKKNKELTQQQEQIHQQMAEKLKLYEQSIKDTQTAKAQRDNQKLQFDKITIDIKKAQEIDNKCQLLSQELNHQQQKLNEISGSLNQYYEKKHNKENVIQALQVQIENLTNNPLQQTILNYNNNNINGWFITYDHQSDLLSQSIKLLLVRNNNITQSNQAIQEYQTKLDALNQQINNTNDAIRIHNQTIKDIKASYNIKKDDSIKQDDDKQYLAYFEQLIEPTTIITNYFQELLENFSVINNLSEQNHQKEQQKEKLDNELSQLTTSLNQLNNELNHNREKNHLLIAIDQLRKQLTQNEPCPVCQSIYKGEHNDNNHDLTHNDINSDVSLNQLIATINQQEQDKQKLLKKQKELGTNIADTVFDINQINNKNNELINKNSDIKQKITTKLQDYFLLFKQTHTIIFDNKITTQQTFDKFNAYKTQQELDRKLLKDTIGKKQSNEQQLQQQKLQINQQQQLLSNSQNSLKDTQEQQQEQLKQLKNIATELTKQHQNIKALFLDFGFDIDILTSIEQILDFINNHDDDKIIDQLNKDPNKDKLNQNEFFDLFVNIDDYQTAKKQLTDNKNKIIKKIEQYHKDKQQLSLDKQNLENLTQQVDDIEKSIHNDKQELPQLTKKIDELNKQIQQKQQERLAIINDKDLNALEQSQSDLVKDAENCYKDKEKTSNNLKVAYEKIKTSSEELDKQINLNQKNLSDTQKKFYDNLSAYGFNNETQFINAIWEKEKIEQLEQKLQNLTQEQAKFDEFITTQQDDIKKLVNCYPEINHWQLNELKEQKQTLNQEVQTIIEDIANIRNRLNDNQRNLKKQQALNKQVALFKLDYDKWAQLDQLIGKNNGQYYRDFVQGLTFSTILQHANIALAQFSDRYLLIPNPSKDKKEKFDIYVLDSYDNDTIRNSKNLSGGEMFIVSLALALGLSSINSHHLSIQSLFLDEGFGTLDDDSLANVLNALGELQNSGKTIGIISHVNSLKDSISAKIVVEKLANGKSRLLGAGIV